ncbi:MAG: hypothetical protein L6V85_03745 [Clostridiales bacterium]|nr:MAG: hypothetical protein L6V85_03745 [Clostridiales bacterium]
MAIKNVGEAAVDAIIAERNANGDFTDLEDLLNRVSGVNINKRMIESMIKGGVFDCFGKTRATLMASYEQIMDTIARDKKNSEGGQMSLFDALIDDDFVKFKYPDIPEYTEINKLMLEKEVLGMYVTGHPLNSYRQELSKFGFNTSMLVVEADETSDDDDDQGYQKASYDKSFDGKRIKLGGIINSVERKFTKRGDSMGVGVVEDLYGQIQYVLYSRSFEQYRDMLKENAIVVMEGTLVVRDDEMPKINVFAVHPLEKQEVVEVKPVATYEGKTLRLTVHGAKNEIMSLVKEARNIISSNKRAQQGFSSCSTGAPPKRPKRRKSATHCLPTLKPFWAARTSKLPNKQKLTNVRFWQSFL